jgi:ATP-binding cassette subfamily D (ALD) long-chain fatty acid import protein
MYAYKDLLELAGLTTRLYTLISTLHNLPKTPEGEVSDDGSFGIKNVDVVIPSNGKPPYGLNISRPPCQPVPNWTPGSLSGDASASAPALVKDLSFIVKPHQHLMITGSNGVGKTSIARVFAGLWAPSGPFASVLAPRDAHNHKNPLVFVVPQRAYMVAGSLLDQVIYPHTYTEFAKSGRTLEELEDILEKVFLKYLPEREGGWATKKEWRDVLSGGEKQRVSGVLLVF